MLEYGNFVSELSEYLLEKVVGQKEYIERLSIEVASVFFGKPHNNFLIMGSSGTGKTFAVELIREFFAERKKGAFSVEIFDASSLTENGFTGVDIKTVFSSYKAKVDSDNNFTHRGLLMIDEADKMIMPTYGREGDNIHRLLQLQFLNVLTASEKKEGIDWNNVLIILSGAFQEIYFKNEPERNEIGFTQNDVKAKLEHQNNIYGKLKKFGAEDEFIGRIPIIIEMNRLSKDDYKRITLKNIKAKQKECLEKGFSFTVKKDAIDQMTTNALERGNLGARAIRQEINTMINRYEFQMIVGRFNHMSFDKDSLMGKVPLFSFNKTIESSVRRAVKQKEDELRYKKGTDINGKYRVYSAEIINTNKMIMEMEERIGENLKKIDSEETGADEKKESKKNIDKESDRQLTIVMVPMIFNRLVSETLASITTLSFEESKNVISEAPVKLTMQTIKGASVVKEKLTEAGATIA